MLTKSIEYYRRFAVFLLIVALLLISFSLFGKETKRLPPIELMKLGFGVITLVSPIFLEILSSNKKKQINYLRYLQNAVEKDPGLEKEIRTKILDKSW